MSWQPGPYGNNPQGQQPPGPQQPPAQQGFPEFQPSGSPDSGWPPAGGPGGYGDPGAYGPPPRKGPNAGVIVVIVVVAVLLIGGLGTGAYLLFSNRGGSPTADGPGVTGDSKPSPTDSLAAIPMPVWEARTPKGWNDSQMTTMLGSWIDDKVVVRGQRDSVIAYNLSDGKPAWQLPTEGVGFCGMSSTTREGVGYLSYGPLDGDDITCTKLQAIEVATGKQRWDVDVAGGEANPPQENDGQRPEVFGDVVATRADGGAERTLKAFDASSGASRWTFVGTANNPLGDGDCGLEDRRLSKDLLLLVAGCAPQARTFGREQAVVFAIDPATGKPRWATPVPTELVANGNANYVSLVGTDYPAIAVRKSGSENKEVVAGLDPASGKLGTPISTEGLDLALTANGTLRMMTAVTVAPTLSNDDSTLVVRVKSDQTLRGEGEFASSCVTPFGLVAFDLKQGKALWDKPAALSCGMAIVGFEGANVQVLDCGGPGDKAPQLLSVDPGGKATPVKQLGSPRDDRGLRALSPGPVYVKGDRVVLVPEHPSNQLFPYFALSLPAK